MAPEPRRSGHPESYRLRAEFVYAFENLLIERHLLGEWVETEIDGKLFELALPIEANSESTSHGPGFDRFEPRFDYPFPPNAHELYADASAVPSGPHDIANVDAVRLSVTWEAAIDEVAGKTASDVIEAIRPEANVMLTTLFDRFRTHLGQPWLGLTGTRHHAARWRLVDFARELTYPSRRRRDSTH